MNEQVNQLVMNADLATMPEAVLDPATEQLQRKQRLAAALRIFGKFGFDEGVAGHITVRDPIDTDTFWVNPMGRSFKLMRVSDLIRVSHEGDIVEGEGLLNGAALRFTATFIKPGQKSPRRLTPTRFTARPGPHWAACSTRSHRTPARFMTTSLCWMITPVWWYR